MVPPEVTDPPHQVIFFPPGRRLLTVTARVPHHIFIFILCIDFLICSGQTAVPPWLALLSLADSSKRELCTSWRVTHTGVGKGCSAFGRHCKCLTFEPSCSNVTVPEVSLILLLKTNNDFQILSWPAPEHILALSQKAQDDKKVLLQG